MRRDSRRGFRFFISFPPNRQAGLTLPETLAVLGVVGVLGTLGVSMAEVIHENRLVTGANDLLAAFNLARTSAISRKAEVVVCPSADQRRCESPDDSYSWWHNGYLVFVDQDGDREPDPGEPVLISGAAKDGLKIKSSRSRRKVVYRIDGMPGGTNLTITFCPSGSARGVRSVIISTTGRARISHDPGDHLPCNT